MLFPKLCGQWKTRSTFTQAIPAQTPRTTTQEMSLQELFNRRITQVFHKHAGHLPPRIAIALSGGVDSMALTHLTHGFSQTHPLKIYPITINHNLRPTSTLEISLIRKELEKLGLLRNHRTMDIHLDTPPLKVSASLAREIEEEARVKRYAAITEVCSSLGIGHILLGHHLDDQLETYCIRLLKKSGVFGLAGMQEWAKAPVNSHPQRLAVVRPLLSVRKEELYAHCLKNGVEWVQDYTNFDENYGLRNVVRKYLRDHEPVRERMFRGFTAVKKFTDRVDAKVKILYDALKDGIVESAGTTTFSIPKSELNKYTELTVAKFLFKLLYPISPSKNYHYSFNKVLGIVPRLQTLSTFSLLQLQWTITEKDDTMHFHITRQNPSRPVEYSFIITPNTSTEYFLFDNTYWFKIHNNSAEIKYYTLRTLTQEDKQRMTNVPKDYKYSQYKNTPILIDDVTNTVVAMPIHHPVGFINWKVKENIYTF